MQIDAARLSRSSFVQFLNRAQADAVEGCPDVAADYQSHLDVVDRTPGDSVGEIQKNLDTQALRGVAKEERRFWNTAFATALLIPVGMVICPPVGISLAILGTGKAAFHLIQEHQMAQQADVQHGALQNEAELAVSQAYRISPNANGTLTASF